MGEDGGHTRSEQLRRAFLASFLDSAALPTGMGRIRAPEDPGPPAVASAWPPVPPGPPDPSRPPASAGGPGIAAGGVRSVHDGHAIWLGAPDAELYRVDDSRWLLGSGRLAAALTRRLAAATGIGEIHADKTHTDKANTGGTHGGGIRGGGPPTDEAHTGEAGLHGDPLQGYLQIIRCELVVVRLRMVPGEGAALPATQAAALGEQAAARASVLTRRAAELRRPRWHPDRWASRSRR